MKRGAGRKAEWRDARRPERGVRLSLDEGGRVYTREVKRGGVLSVLEAQVVTGIPIFQLYRMIRDGRIKTKTQHRQSVIPFNEVVRLKAEAA